MKSKLDLLVVVSKAKKLMRQKGFKVSQEALELISQEITKSLTEGSEEAARHKRKVIKARDLFKNKK